MRARLLLALLLLAGGGAAAPFTPQKLALVPDLLPRERRELGRRVVGKEGVAAALVEAGIDPLVAARLDELAPGPLLVERYAHGLVLEAPGLTERQRAVLDHLHPSVLAAQVALWVQRDNVLRGLALPEDDPLRRRIAQSFDRQVREIEKRYWRAVGFVLTVEQRAALHAWMPQPYQSPANLQGHLYQLPDLTPSQASRLRALITELEAETAADAAQVRRMQQRLREEGLSAEERAKARRALEEATDRAGDLTRAAVERGRRILTPEQLRHLHAIPPLLSPQDRGRHPAEIVQQMAPTPEQTARLRELAEALEARVKQAAEEARAKLEEMGGEIGADSPQSMTMQMMQQGAAGERALAFEEAGRTAFLEILDEKQILGWILTPR